jgi:hypothetical protein
VSHTSFAQIHSPDYAHAFAHTHTHTHSYIRTRARIHTHSLTHSLTHTHVHTRTHAHTLSHSRTWQCTNIHAHGRTPTNVFTPKYPPQIYTPNQNLHTRYTYVHSPTHSHSHSQSHTHTHNSTPHSLPGKEESTLGGGVLSLSRPGQNRKCHTQACNRCAHSNKCRRSSQHSPVEDIPNTHTQKIVLNEQEDIIIARAKTESERVQKKNPPTQANTSHLKAQEHLGQGNNTSRERVADIHMESCGIGPEVLRSCRPAEFRPARAGRAS